MGIPTTAQQTADNLARFESKLAQQAPINDKAFLRVLSALEAVLFTTLYKNSINQIKQVLAITAGETGLTVLGDEYGVPRKVAVAANLTITLPGVNGIIIPNTIDFVGDANGLRYRVDASATITGGIATISVTSNDPGAVGNLNNGDTLTIGTQVPGAETVATVLQTDTVGADEEDLELWRQRILDIERAPGGGGNAADYRNWAQEVAGVARAFPFAGNPITLLSPDTPPERTVYIEATPDINPDGIPSQALLDSVRASISNDPETGLSRPPLGLTDGTLFVEPILRLEFFVVVAGLNIDAGLETEIKESITTQLDLYFSSLQPFVDGVDPALVRNDSITTLTVSNVVQDVLVGSGGFAQNVSFNLGGTTLLEYALAQNEVAKLAVGGVSYV